MFVKCRFMEEFISAIITFCLYFVAYNNYLVCHCLISALLEVVQNLYSLSI